MILKAVKFYPPKTNAVLRDFHNAICASSAPDHHKLSILFYILIDIDSTTGRREFSNSFEEMSFLPKKYSIYMKGLWHLDHQDYENAIEYLTYPTILPTFADEVIEVLSRKARNPALALAYYYTTSPSLTDSKSIECVFTAIAKTNVSEAFFFAREQSAYAHKHMLQMLISSVLHNSTSDQIADRATELIGLPFDAEEEQWFEDYLLCGDGTNLKKAKDTVLMRRIATGKFQEATTIKGLHSKSIGGVEWNSLIGGIENGMKTRLDI